MEAITAPSSLFPVPLNRPLVTVVPRPARARLPELPGALGAGMALVTGALLALAAGSAGLFF